MSSKRISHHKINSYLYSKHFTYYAILGILAFVFILLPLGQTMALKLEVAFAPKKQREAQIYSSSYRHKEALNKFQTSMQLFNGSVYSAVYDHCSTQNHDSGWMTYTYIYSCRLTYFDFFEIPTTAYSYVDSLIQKNTNAGYHLDSARPPVTIPDEVDNYVTNVSKSGISLPYERYFLVVPGNNTEAAISKGELVGPALATRKHFVRLAENGSRELLKSKKYILYTYSDNDYYYRDLGCAYGKLLFCFSPL